jgi:hypothetical protein
VRRNLHGSETLTNMISSKEETASHANSKIQSSFLSLPEKKSSFYLFNLFYL